MTFHDAARASGDVEVATFPASSTTTQRSAVGHEAPVRSTIPSLVTVQAAAPPVGLADVITCALRSTAAHSPLGEQPTVSSRLSAELNPASTTLVTVQASGPPVGLLEVTRLPPV